MSFNVVFSEVSQLKKTLSALMSIFLLISVFSFCASADYQNTHINTGNYAEDIVSVAKTQVGYTASGSDNKYIKRFTNDSGSASASFVAWCAEQAGVPSNILSYKGTLESLLGRFEDAGTVKYSAVLDGDYTPKTGDLILQHLIWLHQKQSQALSFQNALTPA